MPMFMLNGNQYGGNGGNYQVARMSKADYDALTDAQKNDGTLRIVVDTAGNSVNYMSAQVAGAKTDDTLTNLLNPTRATQTLNGVTCTNNGDGTYTLNGTATSDVLFALQAEIDTLDLPKTYKLVGCPSGGGSSTFELNTVKIVGSNRSVWATDRGNGAAIEYPSGATYEVRIRIANGAVLNNVTFKPMLTTDLFATYDDFVGYTGGTGRLNSDVAAHQKEISRINSDLTDIKAKIYEFSTTVTIGTGGMTGYVTKRINLPSDFPQGKVMLLSATGGGYPLPYNSDDFAQHTWVKDVIASQKYLDIRSNAYWENYSFYFAFLVLDD